MLMGGRCIIESINAHELGFTFFLAEPNRRRLRTLLELGPRRRKDVRAALDHSISLNPKHARRIPGSEASAKSIERTLLDHGAPATCHLISSDEALDGRDMPLDEALEAVVGSFFGAFISCIPGELGYFEYEDIDSAYLLRRGSSVG